METTRDKVIRMILEEMDSKIETSEIQDDTNLFVLVKLFCNTLFDK